MGLGALLAAELERRGITQVQAAEEMGVGEPSLSRWLNPNSPRPSIESCAKLAGFLRLSLVDVQRLAGYPVDPTSSKRKPPSDPEWDVMQRELHEIYQSWDRSKWHDLLMAHRAVASLAKPDAQITTETIGDNPKVDIIHSESDMPTHDSRSLPTQTLVLAPA
jgi:transcriptional regulator with XRE-family HTH domain